MRILIAAAGSRGDVAPYTGLGAELRRAGYDVALATTDAFAPLVRAAGLEFRSLPADPRVRGGVTGTRELMCTAAAFITELGQGFADAMDDGTDLLLLSTTTAPLGWHLAEATGTPSLGVYLQPTAPTGDFPPVVTGSRSLGRLANRATGRFALRMADRVYEQAVAKLRHRLRLSPLSPSEMRRRQEQANWPIVHGFSTALVPRPSDWRSGLEVVGNWWPHHGAAERLPTDLEDFLCAGPRPVLIGFGSMASGDGERLSEIAVRALRRAGLRGILQAGSAGLAADGDGVFTSGDVPHALLFPRLAAVVHHGGAGTSAAALRAGVPAVTVPVTADQPFWAGRLAALGAATDPIPFRSLTAERLADSLDRVVKQQAHGRAAARAAQHLATENGADRVLNAIQQLTDG
ncbi:UDP-glucose:sterol glucosyltransferase [Streptomyces viridosporus ATCC 14672]|uniref:UDP-glucose:sterol glucosyltransferase n=1 Tax=Streptomyces viridosporus (strain ATCC 14672 / DSM 40746 / JCM 4963 / KCTC 9882 / NRRL B-12104 / FH 1290) TaxID=566461 RepID=D6A5N4_STRV1|nr:glycosyltransferase [Streptomyces viridosporus]EFE71746.1 UDP-glucose:sterol glucosyltransferase [Streptomyces viridosporus ATCC 14672]